MSAPAQPAPSPPASPAPGGLAEGAISASIGWSGGLLPTADGAQAVAGSALPETQQG
jgi:hypothetical protein